MGPRWGAKIDQNPHNERFWGDFCVFLGVLVLDLFFEGLKVEKVRFWGGSNLDKIGTVARF